MILDPKQDGRALADRAVYEDSSGILELSGSPMIQAERRLLTGKTIKINRDTRVLTAAPEAYLKLPVQGLDSLGVLANVSPNLPPKTAMNTNQFLEVWSEEFDYATNVLRFTGLVRVNFLEGDIPQGKLRCDSLNRQCPAPLCDATWGGIVDHCDIYSVGACGQWRTLKHSSAKQFYAGW